MGTAGAACTLPQTIPSGTLEQIWPEPCVRDAAFLAAVGKRLNAERRYAEAGDTLERALMLDPDSLDARIDYAIALTGMGDRASSLALIEALLADPALPASLRPALENERREAARAAWTTRVLAGLRLGYDSNPLGAPNLSTLSLTTSAGAMQLPLTEVYQAQSAAYARLDLEGEARRERTNAGEWSLYGAAHLRRSPELAASAYDQYAVVVDYADYDRTVGPFANFSASLLRNIGGPLYEAKALSAGAGASSVGQCSGRLGAAAEQRRYPANAVLDGRYLGAAATMSCGQPLSWSATLKLGREAAVEVARPGGSQSQAELRLVAQHPLGRGLVLGDMHLGYYRDARGYSPLLENGLIRTMRRQTALVEYRHPLARDLHVAVGAEWTEQQSRLELFRFHSRGAYAALRFAW